MNEECHFNPDLLTVARLSRAMSQSALQRATGISQSFLSKIERGETVPSSENIRKISNELGFPESFFFQQVDMPGGPISLDTHFRKKASVKDALVDQLKAQMQIALIATAKMRSAINKHIAIQLPQLDFSNTNPEDAAKKIRSRWQVPTGPMPNLVKFIEDSGCMIIPFKPLSSVGVDGATIFGDNGEAFIFLNTSAVADRQRFTLAHELGHVLLHRIPTSDMEDQANRFAAELLMPQADILALFASTRGVIGLDTLAALKKTWRVSIQTLLFRVKKLEIVSSQQATRLWQQLSALRWRLREPQQFDFEPEQPRAFKKLYQDALNRFGGTVDNLAEHLCLPAEEVSKMTAA